MQKTTEELVFLEFEARQSLTVISAPPPPQGQTYVQSECRNGQNTCIRVLSIPLSQQLFQIPS